MTYRKKNNNTNYTKQLLFTRKYHMKKKWFSTYLQVFHPIQAKYVQYTHPNLNLEPSNVSFRDFRLVLLRWAGNNNEPIHAKLWCLKTKSVCETSCPQWESSELTVKFKATRTWKFMLSAYMHTNYELYKHCTMYRSIIIDQGKVCRWT